MFFFELTFDPLSLWKEFVKRDAEGQSGLVASGEWQVADFRAAVEWLGSRG